MFTGAVLAGGASRRMGRDKAFVEVRGRPLVAVAVDALRRAGAGDVLAVGGDGAALARLGCTPVADRWPGEGPLGGLVTALAAAPADTVVVLACDLPFVTADAVGAVLAGLGDGDAAVPTVDGRAEVLLAAWRRSTALPRLEAALGAGERAPSRALAGLDVRPVRLADEAWARDVDTPAELAAEAGPR